ncbi:hypothetical protein LCGC14_1155360 [marine sediment metagenome]|uniref:Uncharacterized protein n=1 Tax=marine sediment metagenome TaxID=412755 RepID=A0A0F9PCF4_9ZZZZ
MGMVVISEYMLHCDGDDCERYWKFPDGSVLRLSEKIVEKHATNDGWYRVGGMSFRIEDKWYCPCCIPHYIARADKKRIDREASQ